MQLFCIGRFYLCRMNSKTINKTDKIVDEIMAEEKKRLKVLSIEKDFVALRQSQVRPDFFEILKAQLCASFSHNGKLRTSTCENRECSTVVSAHKCGLLSYSRFQGFLRTSVRRI